MNEQHILVSLGLWWWNTHYYKINLTAAHMFLFSFLTNSSCISTYPFFSSPYHLICFFSPFDLYGSEYIHTHVVFIVAVFSIFGLARLSRWYNTVPIPRISLRLSHKLKRNVLMNCLFSQWWVLNCLSEKGSSLSMANQKSKDRWLEFQMLLGWG